MADNNKLKYGVWISVGVLFVLALFGAGYGVSVLNMNQIGPKILQYVFLGTDDFNNFNIDTNGVMNTTALLITSLMVWLILFFSFGDVLENFSAFSSGVGWVIAFGVGVVAANVKLINIFMVWIIAAFAWLGALSVFAALIGSFVAFFGVNWGISKWARWLKNRQTMIHATTGREYASEGLKTLTKVGKTVTEEGNE